MIIIWQGIDHFPGLKKKRINELNSLNLFDDEGKQYQSDI